MAETKETGKSALGKALGNPANAPLAGFALLSGWVLFQMLSRPLSFPDDLTHYFSLHRYLAAGRAPHPPGAEFFTAKALPFAVELLYAPVARAFEALGAAWPILAASRFFGLLCMGAFFFILRRYFTKAWGPVLAGWGALFITAFGVAAQTLTNGLARSFGSVGLALFLPALQSRKITAVFAVFLFMGLVYPVALPVAGLALLWAAAVQWRGLLTASRRAALLAAGFFASLVSTAGAELPRLFVSTGVRPMSPAEMDSVYRSFAFPSYMSVDRALGGLAGGGLADWFQYNAFDYVEHLAPGEILALAACLAVLPFLGLLARRPAGEGAAGPGRAILAASGLAAGSFALYTFLAGDPWLAAYRALCWFLLLAGLAAWNLPAKNGDPRLPPEMRALVLAAPAAFILMVVACHYNYYAFINPGRQLQKVFALAAPATAAVFFARLFGRGGSRSTRAAASVLAILAALLAARATRLLHYESPHPEVMAAIAALPRDAAILAHPQTADFILVMTGRDTSTASEMVRVAVMPYTRDILASYSADVSALYSADAGGACEWCRRTGGRGYVLVEEDRYSPQAVQDLFVPWKDDIEKRRARGFFWEKLPPGSLEKLAEGVYLLPCRKAPCK